MTQLSLTLYRRTDPITSREAAQRVKEFRVTHEGKIWGALEGAGEYGVTQNEVHGLSPVQANRRFADMARRGLIRRNGVERSGSCVWVKA